MFIPRSIDVFLVVDPFLLPTLTLNNFFSFSSSFSVDRLRLAKRRMDALKASPEAYLQLHLNQARAAVTEGEIGAIMKSYSTRKICEHQW